MAKSLEFKKKRDDNFRELQKESQITGGCRMKVAPG